MAATSFDPAHAVRFDLPQGSVHAGDGERVLLVPTGALDDIVLSAPPEAAEALGTTVAAVKLRAHRAYDALREALAERAKKERER